jgi:hypothetical protein
VGRDDAFAREWRILSISHIKPGANQITILCERSWLNEIGTGGLMGPVLVAREK